MDVNRKVTTNDFYDSLPDFSLWIQIVFPYESIQQFVASCHNKIAWAKQKQEKVGNELEAEISFQALKHQRKLLFPLEFLIKKINGLFNVKKLMWREYCSMYWIMVWRLIACLSSQISTML